MLAPGQQGQLQRDGKISVIPDVDTDETVAWKEGRFNFENADIATVMRQIARWYDVDVVFEGKIAAERFTGEIPRSSKLAEVFTILELSNIHCKIDNRKVTVMP
jgi:ferric-dicitrate binding protein FerR (iron transport regulator)